MTEQIGDAIISGPGAFTVARAELGDLRAVGRTRDEAIFNLQNELAKQQAELARILGETTLIGKVAL